MLPFSFQCLDYVAMPPFGSQNVISRKSPGKVTNRAGPALLSLAGWSSGPTLLNSPDSLQSRMLLEAHLSQLSARAEHWPRLAQWKPHGSSLRLATWHAMTTLLSTGHKVQATALGMSLEGTILCSSPAPVNPGMLSTSSARMMVASPHPLLLLFWLTLNLLNCQGFWERNWGLMCVPQHILTHYYENCN